MLTQNSVHSHPAFPECCVYREQDPYICFEACPSLKHDPNEEKKLTKQAVAWASGIIY
jgi:hypothetical protein